eukprot:2933289-Alexandrium_andersonii.AAC.1
MRDAEAMTASTALFSAAVAEVEAQPALPCILLGDMNADVMAIEPLRQRVEQGIWTDVAAQQPFTYQQAPLGTCVAHNSSKLERRDFILMPTALLSRIRSVTTLPGQGFDVHLPLQ